MFADMASVDDDIQLVRDLLAWSDLNVNQISKRIKKPNTTLNRFANGTAKFRMARDTLLALRIEFPAFPGFTERPEANAMPFRMEGASSERMRDDLPIYGTALGAAREIDGDAIEQTTLNRAEIVQYAKRPVLLNGRADAYGLYVAGSSMEPRYEDGDMIVVDPKGRIRNGDYVVVYLRPTLADDDDGESARAVLVKRLLRRTASYYELQQFEPAKVFRIDNGDVLRVDRVIPMVELLT